MTVIIPLPGIYARLAVWRRREPHLCAPVLHPSVTVGGRTMTNHNRLADGARVHRHEDRIH